MYSVCFFSDTLQLINKQLYNDVDFIDSKNREKYDILSLGFLP